MLPLIPDILALILLGIVLVQDFKERAINWMLIPAIAVVFLWKTMLENSLEEIIPSVTSNLIIVTSILLVTGGYFFLKTKSFRFADRALGWGDILLLFVLCPALHPVAFMLFLSCSFVLTLLGFGIYYLWSGKTILIPLAGCLAFFMMLHIGLDYFSPPGLFHPDRIIALII